MHSILIIIIDCYHLLSTKPDAKIFICIILFDKK